MLDASTPFEPVLVEGTACNTREVESIEQLQAIRSYLPGTKGELGIKDDVVLVHLQLVSLYHLVYIDAQI